MLLVACAGWESAPPTYVQPPAQGPAPSHYAPPPPVGPSTPPVDSPAPAIRVAIASVQLFDNCPDPPEAAAEEQARRRDGGEAEAKESRMRGDSDRRQCEQSTVQLALYSERPGRFRVDAIRVLDPATRRRAGATTLRAPTQWTAGTGAYARWDERVATGVDMKISYKLGDLDMSQANALVGPNFNSYMGPFVLELDVSIDGERRTIRSAEFGRQTNDLVET